MHTEHHRIVIVLADDVGGQHGAGTAIGDDRKYIVTGAAGQLRKAEGAAGGGGKRIDGAATLQVFERGEGQVHRAVGRAVRGVVNGARAASSQIPVGLLVAADQFVGCGRAADQSFKAGKTCEGRTAVGHRGALQAYRHGTGAAGVGEAVITAATIDLAAYRSRRADGESVGGRATGQTFEAGKIELH